jgi:serine/threonine protein kinase
MTLERGTLLNNRYRIVEILGQGGMGSVYRAIDENLGVEVAVKENLFTTDEYERQFRREAVILANLRHPNLPRVTDHFVVEDQGQYLVMDYIEGEDLRQRMDRVGILSEEDVILIGAAICDALSYLDSRTQPIVHRDIKPGNIKITPHGHIYLVDFGLAKILEGSQATTTGARAMTPGYSPPEQYGTARTDNRSDLFSLGATLYAALTGVIPEDALARAMQQAELTTIRKRNPKISRRLAAVLEKSLEIRPDDRYQSAEEFKQALLSVRGITRRKTGEYTVAPPPDYPSEPISSQGYRQSSSFSPDSLSRPPVSSSLPLPASTPLDLPIVDVRSRPRKRRGGFLWALGVIAIFVAAMALVYAYDPGLPEDVFSRLLSISFRGVPSNPIAEDPGEATPTSAPTTTQAPTSTLSPTVMPSPTADPLTQVAAAAASPTPTAVPTPLGGGGGMIAFASDQTGTLQVWVANVDGSGARQVTDMPEGACQPDWSPDGARLVFISPCSRNQDFYPGSGLFLIHLDGTGLLPLTTGPGGDFDPAWSPGGKTIAFTSLRTSGRPRIYLLNLEDNSVTRLSDQYSRDMQPSWSPNGEKIAFVSTRKGPSQIWVMNADGKNQRMFSRSQELINSHPVWSLDGEVILFTQMNKDGGAPYIVAASYTDQEYLEFGFNLGPLPVREARYSPDGLWLVFESWPQGSNHDIYIMAASGAGRVQITNFPRLDFDPVWKPAPQE